MSWMTGIRAFLPQEIPGLMAIIYEKVAAPGLAGLHAQVASEVVSVLRCGRVLDVGAGPGHLLEEIARRAPGLELVGIDLSRTMLRIAEAVTRRGLTAGVSQPQRRVRLVHADVRALPFTDGAFDLVVSTLSLHHWRSPAEGLRECLRATAPGGRCWIYDLRTDVSARTHARFVTGGWLRRLALGRVFRFHGVGPDQYRTDVVAEWLGDGATVRIDVRPTYLKLSMQRAPLGATTGRAGSDRQPVMREEWGTRPVASADPLC